MSKDIYCLTDPNNEVVVGDIRRKFLSDAESNPHLYDPIDVERCRSEDWQIERFLLEKGKPDEALKSLIKAMQWKKSFGIHDRNQTYFPKELFKIFNCERMAFNRDKQGHLCYLVTLKSYKKIGDYSDLVKQFLGCLCENMDRIVGNKRFNVIADTKGMSLISADVPLGLWGAQVIEHYPQVLLKGFMLDLPWPIASFWKIVQRLLSKNTKEKMILARREELIDHIDVDINELSKNSFTKADIDSEISAEILPLNLCKHLDFSDKQIDKFYKVYGFERI